MKGNGRTLLRKFCLEGTVSGLKYFYLFPDKVSRCFWGICIVGLMAFAVLLGHGLYNRFESMPTRITIDNQFEPVATLPYPAITLCSPNQITLSAVQLFNETLVNGYNKSFDLERALRQMLGFYYFVDSDQLLLDHLQNIIELNRYKVPEVIVLLAQNCDDFLRLCFFKRRLYPRCRGLFQPLLTKHGLCCIFNSQYYYQSRRNERNASFTPWLVGHHGMAEGLVLLTDYNPHNALDKSIYFSGTTRVMFTDWTEFPADDESLLVTPYTESIHMIRAITTYCSSDVTEMAPSNRKCSFGYETRLEYFGHYRNSDCDLLCLVNQVKRHCDCHLFYLPYILLHKQNICGVDAIPCIIRTKKNLSATAIDEPCVCPRDCDAREYRVDASIGNLGGLPYSIHHVPALNKSSSLMRFFFRTPVYVKQKQETVMSYTTLISNLGGVFGLCLGCSVVSVVEIMFYKYRAARNALHRRRLRRRRPAVQHYYYE